MASPPPLSRIKRPPPVGALVARFVLPLELCQAQNRTARAAMSANAVNGRSWRVGELKAEVAKMMGHQVRPGRREPLPGRPFVRCIRFSTIEPDTYADWAKMAVDVLCKPTSRAPRRLGFLRDDRPKDAEVSQHWEPARKGEGFVLIQVFTGEDERKTA